MHCGNHILAINEETLSGTDSAIDLATEFKAVVFMIHNCPEGFTTMKLLCIHPQTTNESAHTFNDHIYNVLKSYEKFEVVHTAWTVSHIKVSGYQKFNIIS